MKDRKLDKEIINEVEKIKEKSKSSIIIYIVLGLVGLKFGSDFVVNNTILIANNLGWSESFMGSTIIALGTALPEIVTGIISARRDKTDLLLGNIVGSNVINLFLLIGIGSLINPLFFDVRFNKNLIFLIMITVILQLIGILSKKSKINKLESLLFILAYILFICSMM